MDNYPDNVRYAGDTSDSRSPFYIEPPTCDECEEELTQDIDCDGDGYYVTSSTCDNMECVVNKEDEDE